MRRVWLVWSVAVVSLAAVGCVPGSATLEPGPSGAEPSSSPSLGRDSGAGGGAPDAGPPVTPGDAGAGDVFFTVDSAADVHPISRYIYGRNFQGGAWAAQPNLTLNRLGGNRWTAYNWENNASNAGSDYNYQNDAYLGGGTAPGEAVRAKVAAAQAAHGAMLVTVPICGWVAADTLGTDVRGDPLTTRFRQDAAAKHAAFAFPPDLTDGAVYQDEFVSWLEGQFPAAHDAPETELFYSLDNEPDLWPDTHSEIHPALTTYAELLAKSVDYSTAIKAVAPRGKIFGAVSYGWNGYTSLQNAPDANGRDWLEFFLSGMQAASASAGTRLLDVLDLHWYPEAKGGGVRVMGEDTGAAVVAARVQAPRSLWDPTYVETSWIASSLGNQPIRLIPLIQAEIAARYPGTALAFTEYYYGGGAHISGAIAQADVLGIFGREGVFAGALWPMTGTIPYIESGFRMFRTYDGAGGTFGDTSVRARTSDVAASSVYASVDASSPSRMVLVAINKTTAPLTAAVTLSHPVPFSHAEVYQLTAASPTPVHLADVAIAQVNAFTYAMPAMSVSTLVLRP